MPVNVDRGDIRLNGKDYRIDLQSFRMKDVVDFSPRASVPGGSILYNELTLYQPQAQEDWSHGFGFQWYTDAQGYMQTVGNIDTRHRIVMMFTKATASDTDNDVKEGFLAWNNAVWSWGSSGLRKFNGSSWSDIGGFGTVNAILPTQSYLFVCVDNARIKKVATDDAVTDAGLDANATDFSWLIIHNGYIYAGKDGTNFVHYDSNTDLSQLQGDSSDTGRITIGGGGLRTLGAIVYSTNLYLARQDGLWMLGDDLIARRAIDFQDEYDSNNFRSMAVHNGYLVFPIRDTLMQWNGIRMTDITPDKLNDAFPYRTYGRFDNFVVRGNNLYMTARTNDTTWEEHLLCFDGVGWHKLADLCTNGSDTVTGMGLDPVAERLWYHVQTTSDVTYYIPLQLQSNFPKADFPTTGTHELHLSRFNMGFGRVKKSMPSLLIEASNVTTARYLTVLYKLDFDASWTTWGTITQNGVTELTFPGTLRTREFNFIKFKIQFTTDSATQSPILETFVVRFLMRPEVLYGYSFQIPLSDYIEYGPYKDSRTSRQILDDLETARDSKAPIEFIDIFGRQHYGYITSMDGRAVERQSDDLGNSRVEAVLHVNFIEVSHAEIP